MPNLTISSIQDIHYAKATDPNLGKHGGVIEFDGRTYKIDLATQTVQREFKGIFSRVFNATKDFFMRGSLTTRAETMGNIIFGRERPILSTGVKSGTDHQQLQRMVTAKHPGNGLKYRVQSSITGRRTSELRSPNMPELLTSEGFAKQLDRRVVVRAWLHDVEEGDSNRPDFLNKKNGHSSIELTNKTTSQKKYMGLYHDYDHPGSTSNRGKFRDSYRFEKIVNIADRTVEKLEKNDIKPGPLQHRIKHKGDDLDGQYGISASSKIYLPCFGKNQLSGTSGAPRKIMFGLSEVRVREAMENMSEKENLRYSKVSKDRNCSGFVMQMLISGGATKFVTRPKAQFYYAPKEAQQYARDVQQHLDWINEYADQLIDVASTGLLADTQLELNGIKKAFGDGTGTSREVRNAIGTLTSKFNAMNMESRMDQAHTLVKFLAKELGDQPQKTLASLPPAKKASYCAMIRMLHLIREEIN